MEERDSEGLTMKVKVIGFKVGKARPTYNRTLEIEDLSKATTNVFQLSEVGDVIVRALMRSDFLSIRLVE